MCFVWSQIMGFFQCQWDFFYNSVRLKSWKPTHVRKSDSTQIGLIIPEYAGNIPGICPGISFFGEFFPREILLHTGDTIPRGRLFETFYLLKLTKFLVFLLWHACGLLPSTICSTAVLDDSQEPQRKRLLGKSFLFDFINGNGKLKLKCFSKKIKKKKFADFKTC